MPCKCNGTESSYNRGCRCDLCKRAATDARRERRRLEREAVGELAGRTRLVSVPTGDASTSGNVVPAPANHAKNSCVAAVLEEISALKHPRPGLVAVAIAMAAVLDNPKAVSSQPPAAGRLVQVLEKLRSSSPGHHGNLRLVREMTNTGRQ
jgi:hypothetical protein